MHLNLHDESDTMISTFISVSSIFYINLRTPFIQDT